MRILRCLRAPVGGLFRHVLDLAEEQATHGHDVGILAASTTEDRLTSAKFAAIAEKLRLGIARIPISRQPGLTPVVRLAEWKIRPALAIRSAWSWALVFSSAERAS